MWSALIVVSIASCAWAWWLARSAHAPTWARRLAPMVAALAIGTGAYARWSLRDAVGAASVANPSDRQALLSSRIASAYTVLAIGWGLAAVAIAALSYATLRRPASGVGRTDR